ncbi:MAG: hypothetical protein MUC89_17640 [Acetobacteraceae bacterium]|jgi:hypothetical protein|nr:hypothetical protein [Acetobacteraceae bacterium]
MAKRRDYITIPRMLPPKAPSRWSRRGKILSGWGFLLLGVVGLFLPFLQGFLFLAVGLYILRDEYAWAQRTIDWMRRKFPRYTAQMDQGRDRAAAWLVQWRRKVRRTVYQVRR